MSGFEIRPEGSLEIVINGRLINTYIGLHMTSSCEELVSFREDLSSCQQAGKFHDFTPKEHSLPEFTCSKLTIETLEQGVKYVQS